MPIRKYPPKIKASIDWNNLIDFLGGETSNTRIQAVISSPPAGKKRIQGMYWDPKKEEVVLIIEE